jgi:glycosyltransferase involved in cell wall biosynthesis
MLVSILIPVFNEELYLENAIESVVSQNLSFDLEVILVDDFSTDNTLQVARCIERKYESVKLYQNSKKGKNNAFNYAFLKSSGEVICFFAGDDLMVKGGLNHRISPFLKDRVKVSACKMKIHSENKRYHGIVIPKKGDSIASGGTIAIRRAVCEKIFPLPIVLANEDGWLKCYIDHFVKKDEIVEVPKVCVLYRRHAGNSLKSYQSYGSSRKSLKKRMTVYSVFLEKFRDSLSSEAVSEISNIAAANQLRETESTLSLLFMRSLDINVKIKMASYSSKFLFNLIKLSKFISDKVYR